MHPACKLEIVPNVTVQFYLKQQQQFNNDNYNNTVKPAWSDQGRRNKNAKFGQF